MDGPPRGSREAEQFNLWPDPMETNRPARYRYKLRTVDVVLDSAAELQAYSGSILGDPEVAAFGIQQVYRNLDHDCEHFGIFVTDGRHRLSGYKIHSSGTRTQAPVDPARVFRAAIALDAAAIILAHNHPSGQAEPSSDDIELTRRLVRAGEIIGIPVHDHIILGFPVTDRWLSLRRSRPGLFG